MPVQEIVRSLGGTYTATGLYSLEFREEGRRGPEVFWLLPPERYNVVESSRSVYTPTLKGGIVTDHGNEAKDITVEGSLHYYYAGVIAPGARDLSRVNALSDEFLDGYSALNVLRFVGIRYRDYTLALSGRNREMPFWSRKPTLTAEAVQRLAARLIERGKGALGDKFQPVWHAYDEDDHFLVRIDRFSVRRSSDDIWTAFYTLEMQGFAIDDLALRTPGLGNSRTAMVPAVERLINAQSLMSAIHPVSVPATISVSTAAGAVQVPGRTIVKQSPVII